MRIKATIVAYAFSVQYFENATTVAYAGLRVKLLLKISILVGHKAKLVGHVPQCAPPSLHHCIKVM